MSLGCKDSFVSLCGSSSWVVLVREKLGIVCRDGMQGCKVMLVARANLRRMHSIRCLFRKDTVRSAPKESTGDFVDASRKVVDGGR